MKKYIGLIATASFPTGIWFAFTTHTVGNIWNLVTGRGYYVPIESTIAKFKVDRMNEGSGEWWIVGQDDNYYFLGGLNNGKYAAFPKQKKAACSRFEPEKIETWCSDSLILHHKWSKKWHW